MKDINCVTYSLSLGDDDSDDYYEIVDRISDDIATKVLNDGKEYINGIITFIEYKDLEKIRSRAEYGIELLLIGVMLIEYNDYARAFNPTIEPIFKVLNNLRDRKQEYKVKIDKIRGKLNTKILMKKRYNFESLSLGNLKLLIKWMNASGDFKEEVLRLKNWEIFLSTKDGNYINYFLNTCMSLSNHLNDICKNSLGKYSENVDMYLKKYKEKHFNKEDIIYCGKGEIQYFFNMVSAEIMNKSYREEFLRTSEKFIFLPSCMCQTESTCLSEKKGNGYICKHCSRKCNINEMSNMVEKYGYKVLIIPHEASMLNLEYKNNESIGIIGIACVLNLVSGGLKAIRLGFKPQCIVLDYCGCKNHWREIPIMTDINFKRLKQLIIYSNKK
ncbi:DUF116 domain-containing protein [Romboutsia weinsteinii]|uniref:DUF116 domain-containing protein n=1 Tax=Romboutsia weinsteinii TaxID=2020949 RepID=A0A371J1V0_9FIRM|nr:DUF116 domain-containing protein [Romboutsia weinsteinii]RDY26759.1 DUF116 domain-containing protein [Romboutsia weinsteinii]